MDPRPIHNTTDTGRLPLLSGLHFTKIEFLQSSFVYQSAHHVTWPPWRPKSSATLMCVQQLVKANNKGNTKPTMALREKEPAVTGDFSHTGPAMRSSKIKHGCQISSREMSVHGDLIFWVTRDITRSTKGHQESGQPNEPGPRVDKTVFPGMEISIIKIKRSRDRLTFAMEIPVMVKCHLYIKAASWNTQLYYWCQYLVGWWPGTVRC